ncbi:MAG: DUF4197 domain-containing protein [Pseudohongiellaceae bacterium]
MNRKTKLLVLIMMTLPIWPTQAIAAENWLKKAVNLISGTDEVQSAKELSTAEIGEAFKQALSIGSEDVVGRLGVADGFNEDPSIHIPLPSSLNRVKTLLSGVGLSSMVDDLELRLNRAAESATPIAKDLFLQAVSDMTFEDVMNIYQGSEDSATAYFKEQMSQSLREEMRPIVNQSLAEVGALQSFDRVLGRYKELPFVPNVGADLTDHVVSKGMDGIFFYIAKEEAAIRANPAKQTTDLLKRVFGQGNSL